MPRTGREPPSAAPPTESQEAAEPVAEEVRHGAVDQPEGLHHLHAYPGEGAEQGVVEGCPPGATNPPVLARHVAQHPRQHEQDAEEEQRYGQVQMDGNGRLAPVRFPHAAG